MSPDRDAKHRTHPDWIRRRSRRTAGAIALGSADETGHLIESPHGVTNPRTLGPYETEYEVSNGYCLDREIIQP